MPAKSISMYYVLTKELEKPKFDAHIDGTLLNSTGMLIPNIFGNGNSAKVIADKSYSLKVNEDFSQQGKFRDRLSVKVNNSVTLFVVSERAGDLLSEIAPDQIEFYPFKFSYNDRLFSEYKIVNVLNKIDCADYEKSEIDFESYDDNDIGEGSIYTIDSLVLDQTLIPNHLNIFLLGRHNDSIIIVHERFKNMIAEKGISGFVFCKPEDFQI